MKIETNNIINNNNNNDIQNIKSIWVYIFMLEKMAVGVSEKQKTANALLSDAKYQEYTQLRKQLDKINQEIKTLSNGQDLSASNYQKLQDLQQKQTECLMKIKDVQGEVNALWQVDMGTLCSRETNYTQTAYHVIDDMYTNNPALRRL